MQKLFGEEADIEYLYEELGEKLFHEFKGYQAWLISSNKEALKNVSLKTSKRIKLMNGPLEAFYYGYDIHEQAQVQDEV